MPQKKPLSTRTDLKKEEKEVQAQRVIAKAYRKYLEEKTILEKKDELIPKADASQTTTNEFSPPQNATEEKQALFHHVRNDTILFRKRGVKTLFPKDKEGNTVVNYNLLEHYLNKGIDIRPWVLEAHLQGIIDKHLFISLFQMQAFMNSFLMNVSKDEFKSKDSNKRPVIHIRSLASNVNEDAEDKMNRESKMEEDILNNTPDNVIMNDLTQYLEKISPAPARVENLKQGLEQRLTDLTTDNFYAVASVPELEIYILLYHLQKGIIEDDKKFRLTDKIFTTDTRFKHLKPIYQEVARRLKVAEFDVDNFKRAMWEPFQIALEIEILNQLENKVNGLTPSSLASYLRENRTLFSTIVIQTLRTTGEFVPQIRTVDGKTSFETIIISSSVQDAWLQVTGKRKPAETINKVPLFGEVSVGTKNQLTKQGQTPIGLHYPMLPTPKRVHEAIADEYFYAIHDSRIHYQNMFYLRAYAENIYQVQRRFVDVLRHETNIKDLHTNKIIDPKMVINILDFANDYYYNIYNPAEDDIRKQLKFSLMLDYERNEAPAALEYAFLLVADIMKNPGPYLALKPSARVPDVTYVSYLINALLSGYDDRYSTINFSQKILSNDKLAAKLKEYSHSVCAFMFMCIHSGFNTDLVLAACDAITNLEKGGLQIIRWNRKDGMMVDILDNSYRFRFVKKLLPKAKHDIRYDNVYEKDNKNRLFSPMPNWLIRMLSDLNVKIKTSSISKSNRDDLGIESKKS